MARLYCGTSGFAYKTWRPGFYPEKLAEKKFLAHYASRINAVEVNYTFRALATAKMLERWIAETPETFQFAVKGHQRISHFERLEVKAFTQIFFESIAPLRDSGKLGPVLFQLPPNFALDAERLAAFVAAVPKNLRIAIEFRNKTWFTQQVYGILRDHGVALCLAEPDILETPQELTADFVYSRLRKSQYGENDLTAIALQAEALLQRYRDVFLFLKHEDEPHGPLNAERLLAQRGATG